MQLHGQSQIKKVILSGSSAISGQFSNDTYSFGANEPVHVKTTKLNFQPSIGVFVSYFVRLGIYTNFSYSNQESTYAYNKSFSTSSGSYLRIYFNDYKISPFVNVNLGFTTLKIDQYESHDETHDSYSGINYGFGLGVEYYIGRKFSFESIIGYDASKFFSKEKSVSSWSYTGYSSTRYEIKHKEFYVKIGVNLFLN
jgi:hypothetical protein